MTFDKPEHKAFLLELLDSTTLHIPFAHAEVVADLKRAVRDGLVVALVKEEGGRGAAGA